MLADSKYRLNVCWLDNKQGCLKIRQQRHVNGQQGPKPLRELQGAAEKSPGGLEFETEVEIAGKARDA